MKKNFFILGLTILVAGTMLIGCLSSDEKVAAARANVKNANENVELANQELNKAKQDSITEFRREAIERINSNKKIISDFKSKIASEKKEVKAKNEKILAKLEDRNNNMEKTLSDYKEEGESKWLEFKIKFNNDLDELGKAFSSLSNKK